MCDFSLEWEQNRPARQGERLELHRFSGGSIGACSPDDRQVAVCLMPDVTELLMSKIPEDVRARLRLDGGPLVATFVQQQRPIDMPGYRDAVRFRNGQTILLQDLCEGVEFTVVSISNIKSLFHSLNADYSVREDRENVPANV